MIIEETLIDLKTGGTTKEEVIRHLAELAQQQGRIQDIEEYIKAVLHRETEYSTAMGFGIAIPHGKTAAATWPRPSAAPWKSWTSSTRLRPWPTTSPW